ncbi:DUF3320 domain-containing protein [Lapillicoccus jejuensis]|uniref:AAA domain-containing protein n=1 Tax=Lapillicoccus jejuensis TaxID=402171 RepID=A0A542E1Z0_9MICO|nr:DUF3320 domain-containing protein [Lapillicoccus jejuensis]TQJ09362.1 AAA domain-containing protein [Lapillicoccus jejuensis]
MQGAAGTPVDAPVDAPLVEVLTAPVVSFGMAHSGLPFLHRVVVTPPAGTDVLEDVVVTAAVVDAHGTVLTRPWRTHVDAVRGDVPLVVDEPALRLDPQTMTALEEETAAEVVVSVTARDLATATGHTPVRVLAARQWTVDPAAPVLSLELLATFVQPNHPAVGRLVGRAAQLLEERTRSGSLAVTEATAERRDAVVEAVADAVVDAGVHYAEPPASWGYGQKVRTPGDVLDDRIGTCLDTTVLLASALEHIGITPVLWVARGHAFLGWWRTAHLGLPDAASLEVATAANAVDLRRMGVLETTLLTRERKPPRDLFRRATQAPRDAYFTGGSSDLVGVVDVGMARLLRLLPVPARQVRADGVVEVVEYIPPDPYAAPPPATPYGDPDVTTAPRTPRADRPAPPPRVQAWKNALLDLTLRNRLLNLDGPMTSLPLVTPPDALGTLASLLQQGRTVSVRAVDDLAGTIAGEGRKDAYALPGDVLRGMLALRATTYSRFPGDDHRAALQRLRFRARTQLQETGANPLYLTLGRLDWRLGDRELRAPLLLLPVEIKGVVQPLRIAADEAGGVTLNHSLLEKLRLEYGFTVDGLLEDGELPTRPGTDEVDVDAVVRRVREAIAAADLPFRVEEDAVLGIIAFTGYLLWRDLDEHWETFLERPLVRHLALTPADSYSGGQPPDLGGALLDEVVAVSPVPTDGAQAEAVAAAAAGGTFVLEGPPGTGKSQTITAILADQLRLGRRVLFVAEKGAALDVVRRRLGEVGLLPFALDLHDESARPAEVRARLRSALAQVARPDEDGYRVAAGEVAGTTSTLADYARRLHEPNATGVGLYAAHQQRLARGVGPVLTVPESAVTGPLDTDAVRRAVVAAVPLLDAARGTAAWAVASRVPAATELADALTATDPAVERAVAAVSSLGPGSRCAAALLAARSPLVLSSVTWLLSDRAVPAGVVEESRTERWRAARDELLARTEHARTAFAGIDGIGPGVASVDLAPVRQAVREAASSFFLGRKRRLLAAAAPVLEHASPGTEVDAKRLPELVETLAGVVEQARSVVAGWRALPGGSALPADTNVLTDEGLARVHAGLADVERDRGLVDALPADVAPLAATARATDPPLPGPVAEAVDAAAGALERTLRLLAAVDDDVEAFARRDGLLTAWAATAPERAADAPRWAGLTRRVAAAEALAPLSASLPDARRELLDGAVPAEDAVAALDRGLAAAGEQERWVAGGFDGFDAERHDRSVARFVAGADALRRSLTTALPAKLVEARPFRPGAFFGKVGQLEREIGRTRGGLSVRRLVERYGDVIQAITPCVLVSPDSLARFVPPGSMHFDLVVFDEASQITVADAVGALGRADAAVIAGDSKQMPPSAFAQLARADVDEVQEELEVVPDEESILGEAVHAGVGRLWLSWHYRSQDESLIAFSNLAYYEDRLSSFPAHPAQSGDTGISFHRVPGRFLRSRRRGAGPQDLPGGLLRTNPVEASAVVEEVLRRWRARERSIGVVTFNLQQRQLIEQMLWDSGVEGVAESLAAKQDGLFVKNLENVQGDERDVVLFSTGFSANDDGVLPLNFGPLNRSGGERRLNVAVTRARRRVMVFSSFDPEDLRVEQTGSVGIRDLRRYLEVAKYGVAQGLGPTVARLDTPVAAARSGVDRHRDEIATALRATGLEVRTAVGLSDFQVDVTAGLPGRAPSLAVLLDSAVWAARRTVGDRDALPVTVLQQVMGWPDVARVWLPSWLADPDGVVAELVARARAAAERPVVSGERIVTLAGGPVERGPQDAPVEDDPPQDAVVADELPPQDTLFGDEALLGAPPAPPPAAEADPLGLDGDAGGVAEPFTPYVPPSIRPRAALDGLTTPRRTAAVAVVIREVVEAEGPVSRSRLGRLVAGAHGLTRVTADRQSRLDAVVPGDLRRDAEGFVWPPERDPLRWEGYRTWDGPPRERPLDDVAVRELANALVDVVLRSMGIGEDELLRETARLFGVGRVTAPVRERLGAALQDAVRDGRLAVRGGVVSLT